MTRKDSGYILPMTIVALTLLAFAALLTGRAVGAMIKASVRERLVIADQQTIRTAEAILDAWMADQGISLQIIDPAQPYHDSILASWHTPEGAAPCPTATETSCWRLAAVTDTSGSEPLRGGEAERLAREVTIETRSGCFGGIENCQRTSTTTRSYERSVFAQYQLHFDSHQVPPGAIAAARSSLTEAVRVANPGFTDDQIDARVNDLTEDPPLATSTDPDVIDWTDRLAVLDAGLIVFADGDTFNGPVRTSLSYVIVCGSPMFEKPVEISLPASFDTANEDDPDGDPTTDDSLIRSADGCTSSGLPNWSGQDPGERIVAGGTDSLLIPGVNPDGTFDALDFTSVNSDPCCPARTAQPGIYTATGDVTLDAFTVSTGSVIVYATGNITIRGDIEAVGTNPAGGPNVVALISEAGNIIIDPSNASTTATCLSGSSHSLNLSNVAVLAPAGAMSAPGWHMSTCPSQPDPILRFKGSLAASHLGVYGQLADDGTHLSGWIKEFAYPTDDQTTPNTDESFWLARPPWWPDFTGNEWATTEPSRSSAAATGSPEPPAPEPLLEVNPATVTVTEGSTTTQTFTVALIAVKPATDVTVQLSSLVFLTNRPALTFTPTDWDTPQIVVVDASTYTDTDTADNIFIVELTASGGGYDNVASQVAVTVAELLAPSLVVSPDSLNINENGSDTFTVSLATEPSDRNLAGVSRFVR